MGLLDVFSKSPEKRIKSCQKKVTERYGPPENRQKAIDQLLDLGSPEALAALLHRFTINAEPSITDAEEKEYTYKGILEFGEAAVAPIQAFLRRSDVAASWMLKMLRALVSEEQVVTTCLEILEKLGPEYTRDPEKKLVLINTVGELIDPRVPPALLPFLDDASDDVRIASATALARHKDDRAREPLLKAFVESSDRARVVAAIAQSLAETGFGVQGFREKIEQGLPEGFLVDRAGVVKRRE
jgi:HEAT repeat protein